MNELSNDYYNVNADLLLSQSHRALGFGMIIKINDKGPYSEIRLGHQK